jgi:AcrR family transcriptional regulator
MAHSSYKAMSADAVEACPEVKAVAQCAELIERPLRRDAEANRQKILKAAAEVFASRGLDVTLDEIALHGGVGVGTIYRRFPNKALLIEALFEEKIEGLVQLAAEAAERPDAWSAFVDFLSAAVALQSKNRGLGQVLHSSCYGQSKVAEARSRLFAPLTRLLDAAKAQGRLRPDFEAHDVPLLLLMLGTLASYTEDASPQIWRRYLDFLTQGLTSAATRGSPYAPALTESELAVAMQNWTMRSR